MDAKNGSMRFLIRNHPEKILMSGLPKLRQSTKICNFTVSRLRRSKVDSLFSVTRARPDKNTRVSAFYSQNGASTVFICIFIISLFFSLEYQRSKSTWMARLPRYAKKHHLTPPHTHTHTHTHIQGVPKLCLPLPDQNQKGLCKTDDITL